MIEFGSNKLSQVLVSVLLVGLAATAGCDAVQGLKETEEEVSGTGNLPQEPALPETPTVAPMANPVPGSASFTPPPKTPEQELAEILARQGSILTDADIQQLALLSEVNNSITELDLRGTQLNVDSLNALTRLPALTKLNLAGAQWHPTSWNALGQLTTLEELDAQRTPLNDATTVFLTQMPQLRILNLSQTQISDQAFHHMKGLSSLEEIHLVGTQITGAGFEALGPRGAKAPLRKISVTNTQFGQFGPLHIKGSDTLEELAAMTCGLTDEGINQLKGCDHLTALFIGGNSLTDQGLRFLPGIKSLQVLDLAGLTFVSNATLERIKNMKSLTDVNINNTSCDLQGAQALKTYLPECRVLIDGSTL